MKILPCPLLLPKSKRQKFKNGWKKSQSAWESMSFCEECSGGQRQRGAICRALVMNPKIVVADEPTGNLDRRSANEFLAMIDRLNKEEQVTIIMVTHDPLIASYSSRLVYIKDGTIEQTIEKNEMNQKEYFRIITEINASESKGFLE